MQYIDEKFKIEIYIIHKMLSTSLTKVSSPTALLLCCPFFLKPSMFLITMRRDCDLFIFYFLNFNIRFTLYHLHLQHSQC